MNIDKSQIIGKSTVTTTNPLLKLVLIASLGAVASYFINKQ